MSKRLTKKAAFEMVKENPEMLYKPMPEEFKNIFPVVSVQVAEGFGLHVTTNHTGKMIGMQSASTTCKCNDNCVERMTKAFELLTDNGPISSDAKKAAREIVKQYIQENPLAENICICVFCFSDSQQDMQATMQIPLRRNFDILNNGIIHADWIPVINALYFRGESFGDFASVNAVINFYNLASKNPGVNFTAWTKNPGFFYQAEKLGYKKPANFKLILSSFFINKVAAIPEKYMHLIDAVFTVFTKEFAELHNVVINCGARACLACLRCYKSFEPGKIKYINELLKL